VSNSVQIVMAIAASLARARAQRTIPYSRNIQFAPADDFLGVPRQPLLETTATAMHGVKHHEQSAE